MRSDFIEHKMPTGQACFYRERDHSYWKEIEPKDEKEWKGKGRLTGVSTCAGGLDFEPDLLMRWAAKTNLEGFASLCEQALESPDPMGTMRFLLGDPENRIVKAGLTYEARREERAVEGTNVHKHALHALAMGQAVPNYDELSEVEKGYAAGVVKFWLEHEPRPLEAEQVVCDHALGIAGRYDLRAIMGLEAVMLDCKTSGYISLSAHVQIAGYRALAEACGFGISDKGLILQVTPDGDYDLIPVRAKPTDFILAVNAYRAALRIKREANADRREREKREPVL